MSPSSRRGDRVQAADDRDAYRARFATAIGEGLDDVEHGRVISDAALGQLLDRRYGPLPAATQRSGGGRP